MQASNPANSTTGPSSAMPSYLAPSPPLPEPHLSAATRLRKRINDSTQEMLVIPGVYDGFSARIALGVGFEALYMADLGIAGLQDMRRHAEMIANLDPSIPLIADADTGYGGPVMVARTIREYVRAGVAGCHIEDQVVSKRCGHLQGKELVDMDVYLARIRAAVAARRAAGSDIVVIARTDALQSYGYEEAIRRLKAAQAAGADVGFFEGITSKEQAARIVSDMDGFPMLLNMVYSGATPAISAKEAASMGFRLTIYPFAAISPVYQVIKESMEYLKRSGELAENGRMAPRAIFEVAGLEESLRIDADAGGEAYARGI